MTLAIFDLDNTLLAGDSDHAWGEFLVEEGMVDAEEYKRANDRFYQEYLNENLLSYSKSIVKGKDDTDDLYYVFSNFRGEPATIEQLRSLIPS